MKSNQQDIEILYHGGSGGHLAAHTVLGSHTHFCCFKNFPLPNDQQQWLAQFDQILQQQWQINIGSQWKKHEHWPENSVTAQHTVPSMNRLYLVCNPEHDLPRRPECHRVVIYTDWHTQTALSVFKHCNWFAGAENIEQYCYQHCFATWSRSYEAVRDPGWPMVSLTELDQLSDSVQQELCDSDPSFVLYFQWLQHRSTICLYLDLLALNYKLDMYQGDLVWPMSDLVRNASVVIRLQDLVRTQGRCLTGQLDLPWHQRHADLIQHWLGLHPKALQHRLLDQHCSDEQWNWLFNPAQPGFTLRHPVTA